MRKTAFALFAHPDDESFGPGGTIALLAKTHDVFLICATKGEVGEDHSASKESLSNKREKEVIRAAQLLGIRHVFFLGHQDGQLNNNLYHIIAKQIEDLATKYKPELFLTYENRGISGHLDHIAISMITSYVFYKLDYVRELHYFCIDESQRGIGQTYFVYFPPGYSGKEITKRVNVTSVLQQKLAAIQAHASQIKDVEKILQKHTGKRVEECFIIIRK
jgi:N-acetylglucosamine malate deacetylase 2